MSRHLLWFTVSVCSGLLIVGCGAWLTPSQMARVYQEELNQQTRTAQMRAAYVRQHPELSEQVASAILTGDLEIGMTKVQAEASDVDRHPSKIEKRTGQHGDAVYDEVWVYKESPIDYFKVYFRNGVVVGFGS